VLRNYAAALAPAIWGTTYLTTTDFLPAYRPLTAALLRALPAALVLLAVTRRCPHGAWWWRSFVLGTLNIGAFFALLFVAAYRLPGGVAAAVGAVQPLFVVLISWAVAGERPTRMRVLAAVLGLAGVAMLVLRADARLDLVGVLAAIGAALSMATGIVLGRRWGRPVSLLAMTGWQLLGGVVLLAPLALAVEGLPGHLTGRNIGGYAYLTIVGTAFAYVIWFRGVETLPSARLSMLGLLSPTVAAVLGWSVLGQSLTPLQLVGFVTALAALVIGQVPPRVGTTAKRSSELGSKRDRATAVVPAADSASSATGPGSAGSLAQTAPGRHSRAASRRPRAACPPDRCRSVGQSPM
jgi:probable blue pigment (indigoidine) exporter